MNKHNQIISKDMIPSTCDLILPNLCAEILTALKRYIRKKKNNQLGFKIPTTLPTRPLGKSSGGNTIWAAESIPPSRPPTWFLGMGLSCIPPLVFCQVSDRILACSLCHMDLCRSKEDQHYVCNLDQDWS
jgi:hypothetical protein